MGRSTESPVTHKCRRRLLLETAVALRLSWSVQLLLTACVIVLRHWQPLLLISLIRGSLETMYIGVHVLIKCKLHEHVV